MTDFVAGTISAAETLLQLVLLGKGLWDGKIQGSGDVASELSLFASNLEENISLLKANKSACANTAIWAFGRCYNQSNYLGLLVNSIPPKLCV